MAELRGGLDDEVLRSAGERAVNGTLAGQVTEYSETKGSCKERIAKGQLIGSISRVAGVNLWDPERGRPSRQHTFRVRKSGVVRARARKLTRDGPHSAGVGDSNDD